ncbi:MAG: exopolysaccharide biosynthesis protein [Pseudobdellovibrionaceae bacterium]
MKSQLIAAMDLLQEKASTEDLTLRRIFELLGEEGHALLIIILCLPFVQPIPIPGLSTPLGLLISLVAVFLYLNKPPWMPKRYEKLKIPGSVLIKISKVSEKIWSYIAHLVKERMTFFHDHWFFRLINMLLFVSNGILLALPLPIPFSNTIPVIGILICAIGHTEKDGVLILLSYLWCLVVIFFFAALAIEAIHLT